MCIYASYFVFFPSKWSKVALVSLSLFPVISIRDWQI
uniref:Uncharacterized protein n=1 Tax=Medicago truncatula TaxID=3880 RepID=I3STK5_MEDTR|nr:unknown [Medicago truncatula]